MEHEVYNETLFNIRCSALLSDELDSNLDELCQHYQVVSRGEMIRRLIRDEYLRVSPEFKPATLGG